MAGALVLAIVMAAEPTAADLHAWLVAADQARTAFGEAKIKARATNFEGDRVLGTADFDIYVKGRDRALIVFRGGPNDGRKALTVGPKMWLMVPGAEHPVPITANQRLMGGAAFGDVAQLRFAEDFDAALRPGTETVDGFACRVVDLTAKAGASPFPKVVLWLDAEGDHLPRRLVFALPSGKQARQVTFTEFRSVQGRMVVAAMEIRDLLGPKASARTVLEYRDIAPAKIDDRVFTPEGARAM